MKALIRPGLYVITDDRLTPPQRLVPAVAQAIAGGACMVQFRSKRALTPECRQQLHELLPLCRSHAVPLLINDDVQLARMLHADGVHLGQQDLALHRARELLGEHAIIGVTCHDSLELAHQAEAGGADYVAFGRFFTSDTKPTAPPASLDTLRRAREQLTIPVAAIGGITPENGAALIDAGAVLLAVIHGVFAQPDITAAAKRYAALFDSP
jgi:thiamine-phosphate pyrophosphorylase